MLNTRKNFMNEQPNQELKSFENGTPPDNNLVWAILSTVLCCMPLGIVSIIKSTNVNSLWSQGLYDEARKSAADAKKFAIWSAISAVVFWVIGFVIYFLFFAVALAGAVANGGDY